MSVDFTAIMDHKIGGTYLDTLPVRLASGWSSPSELDAWTKEYVVNESGSWRWNLTSGNTTAAEELFNEGYVSLDGPGGFSATVHKHGLELTHLARWWSFANDPRLSLGLRKATHQIATVVCATLIVFLPDSAYPPSEASDFLWDGKTLAAVEAWLLTLAPPCESILELQNADGSTNELGYLLDRPTDRIHLNSTRR